MPKKSQGPRKPKGWDSVSDWYDGWVGKHGSEHHRQLAIPSVMELLDLKEGERVIDIGSGQGVLAPHVSKAGAHYTGVDVSPRLVTIAHQHHTDQGTFLVGDARQLHTVKQLEAGSFDAAVFLLSIQDMNPLEDVLSSAAWTLREGGRVVLLMTHPCFRIPRQSGWGVDEGRKLRYRRIDRYLTPLPIPMKPYTGQRSGVTTSFHRPMGDYVNGLAAEGLLVDAMQEITTHRKSKTRIERLSDEEIPVFLGLRARKLSLKS